MKKKHRIIICISVAVLLLVIVWIMVTRVNIEPFLEDIDHMVYVLENNFPHLEVAYWAHGIDYRALAEGARESVRAMNRNCHDTFLGIMLYHFSPLFSTGHFNILGHTTFNVYEQEIAYGGYQGEKWLMNLQQMRSEEAARFYGNVTERRIEAYQRSRRNLTQTYGMQHNRFWVRDRVSQPVTSNIIEEGRIAYVSSGNSMAELWWWRHIISDAYRQIAGFEHLIIDMRGNGGGDVEAFIEILLRPILRVPIETPNAFFFFIDGPYVRRFGDILFKPTTYNGNMTITEPYRPINEILADFDFTDITYSDFGRFDYGASAGRVEPIAPFEGVYRLAPNFHGHIWLLTCNTMGSAAQQAAWLAQETGHITLVGDITGGCIGGPRTMAFLPNTGIIFYFDIFYITDRHGRPLEAGTIPHYFNRPGLDALKTVLAMIEEGVY